MLLMCVCQEQQLNAKKIPGQLIACAAETNVVRELFELVDHRKRGYIDFQDLQRMMETQLYSQNTAGKYFVVLSLSEAETLRSILHSVHDKTINEGQSSFALRLGSTVIDKSKTHAFAGKYQTDTALQCLRFLDSDTKYNERDISLLLRAIQGNEKSDRQKWFENVNSCRRRRIVNIDNSSLRLVFQTPDEFFVLQDRAFMSRVRTAITSRGMYIYDAFRAFDTDRNGVLGCTELYSGLCWLGLKVEPSDIYRLIRHIDSDNDGYITFFDFKSSLDMYSQNSSVDKSFKKRSTNQLYRNSRYRNCTKWRTVLSAKQVGRLVKVNCKSLELAKNQLLDMNASGQVGEL